MLPVRAVSDHRIEDGEELPSESNERELGRFSSSNETYVEGLQHGVETSAVHGGQVERGARSVSMTLFEYLAIAFSLVFSFSGMRLVEGLPHASTAPALLGSLEFRMFPAARDRIGLLALLVRFELWNGTFQPSCSSW